MDFWTTPIGWTLLTVGQILLVTVVLLLTVAFLIYGDRKIFAGVQMRKGPNVVSPASGLLQTFADIDQVRDQGIHHIPSSADKGGVSDRAFDQHHAGARPWAVIPFESAAWRSRTINVGVLYLFAVSSLGVCRIIMGGWASSSTSITRQGPPALGRTDGLLRGLPRLHHHHRRSCWPESMNLGVHRRPAKQGWPFWHWNVIGWGPETTCRSPSSWSL